MHHDRDIARSYCTEGRSFLGQWSLAGARMALLSPRVLTERQCVGPHHLFRLSRFHVYEPFHNIAVYPEPDLENFPSVVVSQETHVVRDRCIGKGGTGNDNVCIDLRTQLAAA